jgi:hypothetical protein
MSMTVSHLRHLPSAIHSDVTIERDGVELRVHGETEFSAMQVDVSGIVHGKLIVGASYTGVLL